MLEPDAIGTVFAGIDYDLVLPPPPETVMPLAPFPSASEKSPSSAPLVLTKTNPSSLLLSALTAEIFVRRRRYSRNRG
jgi:hypothetical protein